MAMVYKSIYHNAEEQIKKRFGIVSPSEINNVDSEEVEKALQDGINSTSNRRVDSRG